MIGNHAWQLHRIVPGVPAPVIFGYVIRTYSTSTIFSERMHLEFGFDDKLVNEVRIVTGQLGRHRGRPHPPSTDLQVLCALSMLHFNIIQVHSFGWCL